MTAAASTERWIELTVNGEPVRRAVAANRLLRDLLRDDLGLTGTKAACDDGMCGACSVLAGDEPIKSCLALAVELDGTAVTTVEGLGSADSLGPVQRALDEHFAIQCGFCTPGFAITIEGVLRAGAVATEDDMRLALAGTICRCTGYVRIVEAAMAALAERRTAGEERV